MAFRAFVAPILPGKTEAFKETMREVTGPRVAEEQAWMRQMGITRQRIFLQPTSHGDLAIVYLEDEDAERSMAMFAAAQDPYSRWSKDKLSEIHGMDFSRPMTEPLPQVLADLEVG